MSLINRGNNLAAYTANEVLTSQKRKFSIHKQFTIPAETTYYLGAVMPLASDGVLAAFNQRVIRPIDGDLTIAVSRDCSFDASGLTALSEIAGYQGSDAAVTKFYDLEETEPTGTFEENDTVLAAGSGSNKVGGAFPDTGFRVYLQGKKAALMMTNPSTSSEVVVTVVYSWVEIRDY